VTCNVLAIDFYNKCFTVKFLLVLLLCDIVVDNYLINIIF